MKLAILHYHLNRGGVTQVIANHLRSLATLPERERDAYKVAVVFGGRCEDWPQNLLAELPLRQAISCVVPELDYDDHHPVEPERLAQRLEETLRGNGFSSDETVIHAHNHSLGKNSALPEALAGLAVKGYGLLLHIHDFAEDFRPENYRRLWIAFVHGHHPAFDQIGRDRLRRTSHR